jgi:hypothetical protein
MGHKKPQSHLWHRLQEGYRYVIKKEPNAALERQHLERDYNVSATRRMGHTAAQLVKRRTKYFGDALGLLKRPAGAVVEAWLK